MMIKKEVDKCVLEWYKCEIGTRLGDQMTRKKKPHYRMRTGKWVAMQALSPVSENDWEKTAEETRKTLKEQREVKRQWEFGEKIV